MSSFFLFGAGASYGSGPCYPGRPPLGSEFFLALRHAGGAASRVSQSLTDLFCRDFEAGMDCYWQNHNVQTAELLRDMARLLVQFEPLEGNLYIELARMLACRRRVVFATTNYDLLIEHAIVKSGLRISYSGLPVPAANVSVLKIHGSCNFLPDLGGGQISGIGFDLRNSPEGAILSANVRIATSTREVLDFCNYQDSLAPALAMYHPSKRVLFCREFVQRQQLAFQEEIGRASRLYVVGLRVHTVDEHIWGPLAKGRTPLYYVGPDSQDFKDWARDTQRRNAHVLASSFQDALPLIANHHGVRRQEGKH